MRFVGGRVDGSCSGAFFVINRRIAVALRGLILLVIRDFTDAYLILRSVRQRSQIESRRRRHSDVAGFVRLRDADLAVRHRNLLGGMRIHVNQIVFAAQRVAVRVLQLDVEGEAVADSGMAVPFSCAVKDPDCELQIAQLLPFGHQHGVPRGSKVAACRIQIALADELVALVRLTVRIDLPAEEFELHGAIERVQCVAVTLGYRHLLGFITANLIDEAQRVFVLPYGGVGDGLALRRQAIQPGLDRIAVLVQNAARLSAERQHALICASVRLLLVGFPAEQLPAGFPGDIGAGIHQIIRRVRRDGERPFRRRLFQALSRRNDVFDRAGARRADDRIDLAIRHGIGNRLVEPDLYFLRAIGHRNIFPALDIAYVIRGVGVDDPVIRSREGIARCGVLHLLSGQHLLLLIALRVLIGVHKLHQEGLVLPLRGEGGVRRDPYLIVGIALLHRFLVRLLPVVEHHAFRRRIDAARQAYSGLIAQRKGVLTIVQAGVVLYRNGPGGVAPFARKAFVLGDIPAISEGVCAFISIILPARQIRVCPLGKNASKASLALILERTGQIDIGAIGGLHGVIRIAVSVEVKGQRFRLRLGLLMENPVAA